MIRNLDFLRTLDPTNLSELPARLYEALSDLDTQTRNVAQQTNSNVDGQPYPPPSIDALTVTGQNGQFHIQIQHHAQFFRGVQYYAEYSTTPGFASPHTIHMGDSREHTQFLGNGTYYWRAYAAYQSSAPSAPAYHGGAASPQPVSGGGSIGGPDLLPPQGAGTGTPGQGLSGPGPIAFRSTTGVPPKRGTPSKLATSGGGTGAAPAPGPSVGLPPPAGGVAGSGAGGGGTSSLIYVQNIALSTSTPTINPPSGYQLWIVFLVQSATAPSATVPWSGSILNVSANVDATISTLSPFIFAYDKTVSAWRMVVQGGTAMS